MKNMIPALGLVFALTATTSVAEEITVTDIVGLPPVDVVFLGELHDNPWHHENQAEAVAALKPKAVVFEMLTSEAAAKVTPELISDKEALEAALEWKKSGWPDFDWYYPIFEAAQGAAIHGALVPRDAVRAAIMEGDASEALGADSAVYGLTEPLAEDEQATREAKQMEAHCNALPEMLLPGMVLGQRLRDATMAREVVRAYEATGGPVAVITGNGHARVDWGAPRLLPEGISTRSIAQYEDSSSERMPQDYWIITPTAEREDPCLAFQKKK